MILHVKNTCFQIVLNWTVIECLCVQFSCFPSSTVKLMARKAVTAVQKFVSAETLAAKAKTVGIRSTSGCGSFDESRGIRFDEVI